MSLHFDKLEFQSREKKVLNELENKSQCTG